MSARKPRAEDRSVHAVHEDLSTELTPQSRKRTVFRGALELVVTGKLVQFQHGAATVSGKRLCNDATVGKMPMGRRREATIRKSGDPTAGPFQIHPSS